MPYKSLVDKHGKAIDEIDRIRDKNVLQTAKGFRRALEVADAMDELSIALTDELLKAVMSLQGKSFGFVTDRDKQDKPYPVEVVRDVFMEATLRGFLPVGNEWNIIAGKFYATKEGLARKVREWPGLTDLKFEEGVPVTKQNGALVEYHATWKVDGKQHELHCVLNGESDTRIPVRVNAGMGVDAILGKARRKILARIYGRLTGSEMSVGDDDSADAVVATADSDEPSAKSAYPSGSTQQLFDDNGMPKNDA